VRTHARTHAWSGRDAPLAGLRFRGAQALLEENSAFGRKAVTDKYGRKVKHEIKEDLGKFYDIDDGEEEESAATGAELADGKKKGGKAGKVSAFVRPRAPRPRAHTRPQKRTDARCQGADNRRRSAPYGFSFRVQGLGVAA
jgi:hypothetical protein